MDKQNQARIEFLDNLQEVLRKHGASIIAESDGYYPNGYMNIMFEDTEKYGSLDQDYRILE